jgi:hypothetical protein
MENQRSRMCIKFKDLIIVFKHMQGVDTKDTILVDDSLINNLSNDP